VISQIISLGCMAPGIGRDTISRVTDAVLDDVAAWRSRPLDEIYAIVYLDAIMVKVRKDRSVKNRACYLAIGVNLEGDREVLGCWWQDTEGSTFWLGVLNDLHQRGVKDILISCVDGLEGFPEAIEAVFPQSWVQTCIVHQIRNSMRYVTYKDRRKVAADLKPIYTAANLEDAEVALLDFNDKWGECYPMIGDSWQARWEQITPFLALPADLRKIVYTTNTIENLNRGIRKAIKTRGSFPDEQAATKLIYLAIHKSEQKCRTAQNWPAGLRALKIHFGDRIPN
jgi:putative transposase